MLRLLGLVVLIVFTEVSWGAADYSLIQNLLGTYPVLEQNGQVKVAGNLTISADDKGIGFAVAPLKMASFPATAFTLLTPKEGTTLTKTSTGVTQEFASGNEKTKIEYRTNPGYLSIETDRCTKDDGCRAHSFVVTQGKAPGTPVDTKLFLVSLDGSYQISLAGGLKPKEKNDVATGDSTIDPDEQALFTPYCPPGSPVCFDGYHGFPYAKTTVYRRELEKDHVFYQIIVVGNVPNGQVYQWETNAGKISFRDLQFAITKERVCLEHEMTKKGKPEDVE